MLRPNYKSDKNFLRALGINYTRAQYNAYVQELKARNLKPISLALSVNSLPVVSWQFYQQNVRTIPGEEKRLLDKQGFENDMAQARGETDCHLAAMNRVLGSKISISANCHFIENENGHGLDAFLHLYNPGNKKRAMNKNQYRTEWRDLPRKTPDSFTNGIRELTDAFVSAATTSSFMLPPAFRNDFDAETRGVVRQEKQATLFGNRNAAISGYFLGKVMQYGLVLPAACAYAGMINYNVCNDKSRVQKMNDFKNYAATESEQRKIYDIEQTARPEMEFLARAAGVLLMYKTSTLLIGLMTAHDTLPQQKVSGQPQQIEVQAIRAKTLPQNTYVL